MRPPVVRFVRVEGPSDLSPLTDEERSRHERLRNPADRDAYVAAHLLARGVAGEWLGLREAALSLAQICPECGGVDHGVPVIPQHPDVVISLSHSRGWAAAIAAGAPCGIDVEPVRDLAPSVFDRILSPSERAWVATRPDPQAATFTLWARKEARFKAALGNGTLLEVDGLDLTGLTDWTGPGVLGAWVTG